MAFNSESCFPVANSGFCEFYLIGTSTGVWMSKLRQNEVNVLSCHHHTKHNFTFTQFSPHCSVGGGGRVWQERFPDFTRGFAFWMSTRLSNILDPLFHTTVENYPVTFLFQTVPTHIDLNGLIFLVLSSRSLAKIVAHGLAHFSLPSSSFFKEFLKNFKNIFIVE